MTNEQKIRAILECFFSGYKDEIIDSATKRILDIIEAEPELDEWCTDCKEYDQKRHCCPRFSRVIRETVEDVRQNAQPNIIHCGDCRYKDDGIDEEGIPFLKCLNGRSYGGTRINDFCSWAERRTNEADRC